MSWQAWNVGTNIVNSIAFPVAFILSVLTQQQGVTGNAQSVARLVLLLSSVTYLAINGYYSQGDKMGAQGIRFLDWVFTIPLLLYVFFVIAESRGMNINGYGVVIPGIFAVIAGYLAMTGSVEKYVSKTLMLILTYILVIVVAVQVWQMGDYLLKVGLDIQGAIWSFIVGFFLIFAVPFIKDIDTRGVCYNILDFVMKILTICFLSAPGIL